MSETESDGNYKSVKRKRSSSSHQRSSFRYPTPSSRASLDTILNIQDREQGQEQGLHQKQTQKQNQDPDDYLFQSATLPNDAHTSFVTQASLSFPSKTCLIKSHPTTETRGLASYKFKDQGTQTEVELPETEAYWNWSGRGRSPFKTPATAAIDGLRDSAKYIEYVEREIIRERIELEKVIRLKKDCFVGIARARFEILQDRMNPIQSIPVLAQPDVDQFEGRSRSPVRYIAKMRVSTPPVYYDRIETYPQSLPKEIDQLLGLLEENLGVGSIPSSYESTIRESQPNGLRTTPRTVFSSMEARTAASIEMLCEKARAIVDNTAECSTLNVDENTWGTNVVHEALKWETMGPERKYATPSFSRAENIQSQLLAKSCRQKYQGESFESKKTDWALSFSRQHAEVKVQYEALASDSKPPALSQMGNPSSSRLVLYSATEIKVPKGNVQQAQAQLFTWFQAGVTRLRKLLKKVGATAGPTLPYVGWIVIGERWELYMAIGDGNLEEDAIVILGPFKDCQCETLSYVGAFRLLQLIERVKDWARQSYWLWYRDTVMEPLKLAKGRPMTQEEKADERMDAEEREALED